MAVATGSDADDILAAFLAWVEQQGIELYEAQLEAVFELVAGAHVIVNTPTGSGKSLIACAAHFDALCRGARSFYTAPVKALVSERFFELSGLFGAARVGMLTGDASVNADAPIVCCTEEILANLALRRGDETDIDTAILDEFHYFADPQRGWAWQVPLLEMPSTRFALLSATLGDVSRFEEDLGSRTGRSVAVVRSATRPVPLVHEFQVETVTDTVTELLASQGAPVYLVHFTQAAAVERAQALLSLPLATRAEKDLIAEEIGAFRFSAGFGKSLSKFVRNGIGVHHAGLLPRYRRLVERLAQRGLLKVICGTDTLGVGVNVPIRTVVLTALSKYDGQETRLLNAREFHQIGGRAGRPGYDSVGTVIALAPEHAVENARLVSKADGDARKLRRIVKRKPPPGMVSWGRPTFDRLVSAPPEPLLSSFAVTHALVLQVLSRPGDGRAALEDLLRSPYQSDRDIEENLQRGTEITTSLVESGVLTELDEPDVLGRTVRLSLEMPDDFALNQPLALFAVAAFDLLDPDAEDHALDVVSVVESVLEDPRPIVMAQRQRARTEAITQMKADGLDYDQRMAELDTITAPRPLAELLEPMFEVYRSSEPWAADHELRPKSVVREMFEQAMDFGDYVRYHQVARSEGVLLRYLSDAYRTLRRTVPAAQGSEALDELIEWLGELVRQVDSSLIDEWEQLTRGDDVDAQVVTADVPPPLTANHRAFTVLVRNALFRRVELLARRDWDGLGELDGPRGWTAARWQEAAAGYFAEFDSIGRGPAARSPRLVIIDEHPTRWQVRQILDDPDEAHAWAIIADVDLVESDAQGIAVVDIVGLQDT